MYLILKHGFDIIFKHKNYNMLLLYEILILKTKIKYW